MQYGNTILFHPQAKIVPVFIIFDGSISKFLPPPPEVLEDPDYRKTSRQLAKQLVSIRLAIDATKYHADVYYNPKTGGRTHAEFPAGVVDDVNYAGSIKAFLHLLNNDCCTSIDKSRKFLFDLFGGKHPHS